MGTSTHTRGVARLPRLAAALVACWLLVIAAPALAHARLTPDSSGPVVAAASTAPWVVLIRGTDASGHTEQCSGSLIDTTHVLTAAHCDWVTADDVQLSASQITVYLGIVSDASLSGVQNVTASAIRFAPGYVYPGPTATYVGNNDVAVLTLSKAVTLSANVQPIALAGAGQGPVVGSTLTSFGWGWSSSQTFDGKEHAITSTMLNPWQCGSGWPSIACGTSSTADTCPGDSGSGLIRSGAPVQLVGVVDFINFANNGQECTAGGVTGYVDITSPGLAQWLAGATGTSAPTVSGSATISDPSPEVGSTATCNPPNWTGATDLSYLFIDANNNILQSGPQTYAVPLSMVGQSLSCVAVATNAGGTTYMQAGSFTLGAQLNPGLTLLVATSGALSASGPANVGLTWGVTATLTGAAQPSWSYEVTPAYAGVTANLAGLAPGAYTVCATSPAQGVYAAYNGCASWVHDGKVASYIRSKPTLTRGRSSVQISVASPAQGAVARVRWKGRLGHHTVFRTQQVRLKASTRLHTPARPRRVRWTSVTVTIPPVAYQGASLAGKSLHVTLIRKR